MLTARDVMTREVLVAEAEWTLDELAAFLDKNNITGAPVRDGKNLAGLVSVTDLARAWQERASVAAAGDLMSKLASAGIDASEAAGFGIESSSSTRVRDVMTPVVFSVTEEATVDEMAEMMVRGHIHRVLVMRGRDLVGIVSSLDLLRSMRQAQGSAKETALAEAAQ